jgi:hypothetical protein
MSPFQPASTEDALSIPVIAYRGLWDKFARPCSLGAVQRSYLRGVPTLVRCGDEVNIFAVLELVASPSINRRRRPLFLMTDGLPAVTVSQVSDVHLPDIFAIDTNGPSDRAWPIHRQSSGAWLVAGCYVPVGAWRRGLTAEDLGSDQRTLETVVFESSNVIDDVAVSSRLIHHDDKVLASIRTLVGPKVQMMRASDLVELDLLIRCTREAA